MSRTLLRGASVAVLLLAAPGLAAAADAASPVSEVIVTGTRDVSGVQADKIGSSVTVITADDMELRQVRMVSDVLRDVPGFAVSRSGGPGGFTQVRVRGTESNHVLTLIDGIQASDPFQGEFDFATLLADDTSRIEILRGPQSALYGSDAIAGVVNYITPTGAEAPGLRVRAEAGSFGTYGAAGRAAGVSGNLDYVVNAGFQNSDGYVQQTLPGGSRKVGADQLSYSAKLSYRASDILTLRAVARYTDTQADVDDYSYGRGQVDSPGSTYGANALYGLVGGDLSLLDGRWTHSLTLQGMDAERKGYSAYARSSGDKGGRQMASYATTYRIEAGALTHRFTGAADWKKETYQNTSPPSAGADGARRSVNNTGVVGEYDLDIGQTAGIGAAWRHDQNDYFQNADTVRVQGFWRFAPAARVRAAAGTGIKNPGQTELFGYNATGFFPFVGNPRLKPEKSRGWEIGGDLYLLDGALTVGATYFQARLTDEIFSASRSSAQLLNSGDCPVPALGVSTTCNRATDSTQKGVELFGDWRIGAGFSLSAAYTHLNAKENGIEEIRRAPDIASANLTWKGLEDRATVNLNVRYNGEQTDSNFSGINAVTPPAGLPKFTALTGAQAGQVKLASFTLINLGGGYRFNDRVEVYGRIENLLDKDYYEVFSYPTPGRAAYVGVRLSY